MIVSDIDALIKTVVCIYNSWDGITENAEEIERFHRHAGGKNLPHRTRLDLSRANFIRRLLFYPSLSRQIQRAHEDMNFLAQEFNIEQSIDNSAISYAIKAAQERDRRIRDAKCRTILEQSNGGSHSHELLEVCLEDPPKDMEETSVFCFNRLKEDITSKLERALLSSVMAALEARMKYTKAALEAVIHRNIREGQGPLAQVFDEKMQGQVVPVKLPDRRLHTKVRSVHRHIRAFGMRSSPTYKRARLHRERSIHLQVPHMVRLNKLRHSSRARDAVPMSQIDHGMAVPSPGIPPLLAKGKSQTLGIVIPGSPSSASELSQQSRSNANKLRSKRK
ncbi:hypothetical protein BC629DRAFT_1518272 [Irpex lacteus]|nr:hypothetical protein BC629DRAFT_1518272 [Irpex lacteus]